MSMLKYGIFIRSSNNDNFLAKSCVKLLQDLKLESKIVTISRSVKYDGLQVFFDSNIGMDKVLKKKFLPTTDGENPPIHQLNTFLKVHNAIYKEEQFKEDIQSVLEEMGLEPVLQVTQIPFSEDLPDIGSGNWKVVLDIPEVEELEMFKRNGLPDQMFLKLPHSNNKFRVTFSCCLCEGDGHTSSRCSSAYRTDSFIEPIVSASEEVTVLRVLTSRPDANSSSPFSPFSGKFSSYEASTPRQVKRVASRDETVIHRKASSSSMPEAHQQFTPMVTPQYKKTPNSNFRIRDRSEENNASSGTVSSRIIDKMACGIGNEEALNFNSTFPISNFGIKKEIDDLMVTATQTKPATPQKKLPIDGNAEDGGGHPFKKFCSSSTTRTPFDFSNTSSSNTKSNTGFAADFLPESFTFQQEDRVNDVQNAELSQCSRKSEDSGVVTTSTQEETLCSSRSPFTDGDEPNDQHTPTPGNSRENNRKRTPQNTYVLRIPDCIRSIIEKNPGVLSADELEAYLNHVKKKSRPADFARHYTDNVLGLMKQLEEVKKAYYYSPIHGGKEGIAFMKRLDELLKRFHF